MSHSHSDSDVNHRNYKWKKVFTSAQLSFLKVSTGPKLAKMIEIVWQEATGQSYQIK